ncbi:hypothetical protein TNCV_4647361 [Trichonephila clavipes]|uniref:Uncharacterized protein n=1 Tax=Trichonephila clavipes TaxID=2585209 RepID=A0A8X6VMZ8_TRICX|nr:hypothetical protein TNCV_4647361 [Trichonephila clavipes]
MGSRSRYQTVGTSLLSVLAMNRHWIIDEWKEIVWSVELCFLVKHIEGRIPKFSLKTWLPGAQLAKYKAETTVLWCERCFNEVCLRTHHPRRTMRQIRAVHF